MGHGGAVAIKEGEPGALDRKTTRGGAAQTARGASDDYRPALEALEALIANRHPLCGYPAQRIGRGGSLLCGIFSVLPAPRGRIPAAGCPLGRARGMRGF